MGNVYESSEFRKGLKVSVDGQPYTITEFQFVKPGKGVAFTRTRLKNLRTGAVIDRTFRSGEKVDALDAEERDTQYLYQESSGYVFMDQTTYDQFSLSAEQLGDAVNYLIEGLPVRLMLVDGRPLSVELPNFVEMEVTEVGAGSKGDRVSGSTKDVTFQTGYTIQGPVFLNVGDVLRIDTRTGEYIERVKIGRG